MNGQTSSSRGDEDPAEGGDELFACAVARDGAAAGSLAHLATASRKDFLQL